MVFVGRTKKKGLMQRNHVVWTKRWVYDDWCSLQRVNSLPVLFCALRFVLLQQHPSTQPTKGC